MKDPILLNKMWREVEAGRVISNQSGSLTLFKYTQKTIIEDLWNDVNRQARGIIFDIDGRVVARPFNKFFNMNEREETKAANLPWSDGFEIFEKLDGSCGTGYIHDSQWKLATPGSMESDQALEGTRILNEAIRTPGKTELDPLFWVDQRYNLNHLPVDCTPIFEILYPENRIVVDYHGERAVVLLAIFEHNGEEWHPRRVDQIAQMCGFRRPKEYRMDLREATFEDNTEGYVCRFDCGLRVKVKSPTYLRIHRLLDAMSPKGVIALIRGREYGVTVKQLPPEIAKDFDDIRALVQGMYDKIFTDAHANLNRMLELQGENTPRKQQALWVQENVDNMESGFVFALLDDKEIEDKIWKLVTERIKDESHSKD